MNRDGACKTIRLTAREVEILYCQSSSNSLVYFFTIISVIHELENDFVDISMNSKFKLKNLCHAILIHESAVALEIVDVSPDDLIISIGYEIGTIDSET